MRRTIRNYVVNGIGNQIVIAPRLSNDRRARRAETHRMGNLMRHDKPFAFYSLLPPVSVLSLFQRVPYVARPGTRPTTAPPFPDFDGRELRRCVSGGCGGKDCFQARQGGGNVPQGRSPASPRLTTTLVFTSGGVYRANIRRRSLCPIYGVGARYTANLGHRRGAVDDEAKGRTGVAVAAHQR